MTAREGRPETPRQAHGATEAVKIGPRAAEGAGIGTPVRVQLRRTKGWRKPEGAIVVARPSRWGNPIRITRERNTDRRAGLPIMYRVHGSPMDRNGGRAYNDLNTARHFAARFFEWDLLNGRFTDYPSLAEIRAELAGHDLACWCPPRRVSRNGSLCEANCHADVLLEIADQDQL